MLSGPRPSIPMIMYSLGGALLFIGAVICGVALRLDAPSAGGFGLVISVIGYVLIRIIRKSKFVTASIIILWLALLIGLATT